MEGSPVHSEKWLFEFKLNGFVILKNLLPVELVDAMNRQFRHLLELEIDMNKRGLTFSGRGKNRYAVNIGSIVEKTGGPLNDPRARKNPIVEDLVTRILGKWTHGKLIVECPCKGSDYMGWHIDSVPPASDPGALIRRTTQVKFHVPLVEVNDDNGPLELIPGSHRMMSYADTSRIGELSTLYSTRILTRKGDCILRDGDLFHRGTPNETDEPRPLYSQAYKTAE